ncbi:MAG: class I SAM-dependent methyltransferase [Firmicutes bacterium]|nr:class I SAM-dependent methyltransferase [Bacillota bacterium]
MSFSLESTKKEYNEKSVLETYKEYAEYGLWKSEKCVIKKYFNKADKILDIGCGAGRTTIGLYEMGYKNIIGLDIAEGMIEVAKQLAKERKLPVEFVVGNALELPYEDNSFDRVLFSYNGIMCIPKVKNREKVLSEIYRVLKPGGIFVFTAHDNEDESSKKYEKVWAEEMAKWERGEQDPNLEVFGDIIAESGNEGKVFIHISTLSECKNFIATQAFKILYTEMRRKIAKVPKYEENNFGECRLFVVQK